MKRLIVAQTPWYIFLQVLFCILITGITLFSHIEKQNELTELRLAIPTLARELREIQEENRRLKYEIDRFENPIHLMELLRKPEYNHLKFPYVPDVVTLPTPEPLTLWNREKEL